MTKQTLLSAGRFAVLAVAAAALLTGCKTPKPDKDTTPPKLRWAVINKATNKQTQIVGTGTINAKLGDAFTVEAIVDDPEGVHQITEAASASWSCRQGNIAQSAGPGLGVLKTQNLNPDSKGNVLTSIFIIDNADLNFTCQPGFTFSGGSVQFFGTGTNYANQTVKGTLTISAGGG
jgi:hypothetical protein